MTIRCMIMYNSFTVFRCKRSVCLPYTISNIGISLINGSENGSRDPELTRIGGVVIHCLTTETYAHGTSVLVCRTHTALAMAHSD